MARLWVVVTAMAVLLAVSLQLTAGHRKERKEKTELTSNGRRTFTLENLVDTLEMSEKRYQERKGLKTLLRTLLERRTEQKSAGRKREKADLPALEKVFNLFCTSKGLMDKSQFAKLTRDQKLLDKKLTATDVGIIFAKAKADKTDRKIDFKRFQDAVKLMAEKKYPGDQEGFNKLVALIVEEAGSDGRFANTTKYGGNTLPTDESGPGKGKEGRPDAPGPGHVGAY